MSELQTGSGPSGNAIAAVRKYKAMKNPVQPMPADTSSAEPANYSKTDDPTVYKGKHGFMIKKDDYDRSQGDPKNNMKFNSFEDYADWKGSWAKPVSAPPAAAKQPSPPVQKQSDQRAGFKQGNY